MQISLIEASRNNGKLSPKQLLTLACAVGFESVKGKAKRKVATGTDKDEWEISLNRFWEDHGPQIIREMKKA